MSVHRPYPSKPIDTTEAGVHTRSLVSEAIGALTLLAAGDASSADSALKRVMIAAGDARAALQPALAPDPKAQVDQALQEWST